MQIKKNEFKLRIKMVSLLYMYSSGLYLQSQTIFTKTYENSYVKIQFHNRLKTHYLVKPVISKLLDEIIE
jgi:hypothetical protein